MKRHQLFIFFLGLSVHVVTAQTKAPPTAGTPPASTPPAAHSAGASQQSIPVPTTITGMKAELEKSPNPVLYTKQILKKRFKIDTVVVTRTRTFNSLADSLAYNGKEKKVYGPYGDKGNRFLVQVLSKAPNQFYHIGQIFIDTTIFRYRIADSLGNKILEKLRNGTATFEQLAQTYSMGGEASLKGDLGWIARGVLLPQIEHDVNLHKKGEVFKVWSRSGMHIIKKIDEPKQDIGFALMMQVFL